MVFAMEMREVRYKNIVDDFLNVGYLILEYLRIYTEVIHRDHGNFRPARGQGRSLGNYNLENSLNLFENNPQIIKKSQAG